MKLSSAASWWLNENAGAIAEQQLWPLWDRITDSAILDSNTKEANAQRANIVGEDLEIADLGEAEIGASHEEEADGA